MLGPLPYELKQLVNLIQLQIDSNNFEGRIPDGIGRLSKLVVLYLGGNKFERTPPSLHFIFIILLW